MARYDDDRVRRDQAGVGPSPDAGAQLIPIDDLDGFKIADGEPDIRGWNVYTVSGREIGEVDDLLVDARSCEVVMVDIDLKESEGHAEVPIRSVQLDRGSHRVLVDSGDIEGYAVGSRRERLTSTERDRLRDEYRDVRNRDIRYDTRDASVEETVVERRPVVMEEVVVRRRVVDPNDPTVDNERIDRA